jgi:dihydrofolate synthase/folylpolyglutamate synthase
MKNCRRKYDIAAKCPNGVIPAKHTGVIPAKAGIHKINSSGSSAFAEDDNFRVLRKRQYKDVQQYLDAFINYEKKVSFDYKSSFKIERVKRFLEKAKVPYRKLGVIHVAGTKGKGSTVNFCADLLACAGYKVGVYTSPHFFDFRERIIIKYCRGGPLCPPETTCLPESKMIPKKDVVRIVEEMKPHLEESKSWKDYGRLTFFEVYTAIAFKYFIEQNVDFAVLETGMGGRLDATNVANPLVCVITKIGYDHTDKLGRRLCDIAYEKCGIIKKGIPVVSSGQRKSVYEVIRKKCKQTKSDMFVMGRDFKAEVSGLRKNESVFDFKFREHKYRNIKIALKGDCQIENACLALTAVNLLKEKGLIKSEVDFKKSVRNTYLPGRFEIVSKDPLVILDIAHNQDSFSVLNRNLKSYFPKKNVILIFAASKDKNVRKMLENINYRHLILTRFNGERSLFPREIADMCKLKDAAAACGIKEAFGLAKKMYKRDSVIVISGSLFLVSEAMAHQKRGQATFSQ